MRSEERFGSTELPGSKRAVSPICGARRHSVFSHISADSLFLTVWIERTAVGSSVQALLHALRQLRLEGEIAGRALTRMAEVLEGRHTDEEIAQADASVIRDLTEERPEATKRRLSQVYSPTLRFCKSLHLLSFFQCADAPHFRTAWIHTLSFGYVNFLGKFSDISKARRMNQNGSKMRSSPRKTEDTYKTEA